MQITIQEEIAEKLKSIPNPDEFVNSVLRKVIIKNKSGKKQLAHAAEILSEDYLADPELTIFTALDGEDFHA